MARRDLSTRDVSEHAASELEYIITRDKKSDEPVVPTVSVEEAMSHERVFKRVSNRDVTRVLFVSSNTRLLNPTQQSLDGYINISELFDEVHILILRKGIKALRPVLRPKKNVWIYTASSRYWWLMHYAGKQMIEDQLVFANGFRPDLIVARDPFESALVVSDVAKKYNCPSQLHILEDYTTREFLQQNRSNFWRRFVPLLTIPRFASVRTITNGIEKKLEKRYTIPDLETLPRLQNYETLIKLNSEINLKEKYKPLIFFLVFVGNLSYDSTLHRAIDAARFVLQNRRVGMIVLGDGPARGEFQKRAKTLGIEEQVIFETKAKSIIPYLKSAHMMIVTDTTPDSEELVLKGAAAGIPMIMSRTEKREDVFEHGESAFLCDESDVQAFTDRINDLLNDVNLRKLFVESAQRIISMKFHEDPYKYREAYRLSIEQALFIEMDEEIEHKNKDK